MPEINIECNSSGIMQLEEPELSSIVDVNLTIMNDAQLLDRYADGDENAFRELVYRYKDKLYAFLKSYLHRHDLVEDVFQETFLRLYVNRDSFDHNLPLSPWLFTIAANKAKDVLRERQRKSYVSIGSIADSRELSLTEVLNIISSCDTMPCKELEKHETLSLVQEIISKMPEKSQEILLLAYFDGFTYKQMAEILCIPVGTVKSRLHSAVGRFAKLWKSLSENKYKN